MSFLLDTNILSEIRKPKADANVQRWFRSVEDSELYVSVLAVGEIRQGVERLRRRDKRQSAVYDSWLADLQLQYRDRVLAITSQIADEWGRLNVPDPLGVIDGLMAATAKDRGLTFVTRNTAGLARTGVALLDPFEPQE